MLTLEMANERVDALRLEAERARGHDGVPTAERVRSLMRRRRTR